MAEARSPIDISAPSPDWIKCILISQKTELKRSALLDKRTIITENIRLPHATCLDFPEMLKQISECQVNGWSRIFTSIHSRQCNNYTSLVEEVWKYLSQYHVNRPLWKALLNDYVNTAEEFVKKQEPNKFFHANDIKRALDSEHDFEEFQLETEAVSTKHGGTKGKQIAELESLNRDYENALSHITSLCTKRSGHLASDSSEWTNDNIRKAMDATSTIVKEMKALETEILEGRKYTEKLTGELENKYRDLEKKHLELEKKHRELQIVVERFEREKADILEQSKEEKRKHEEIVEKKMQQNNQVLLQAFQSLQLQNQEEMRKLQKQNQAETTRMVQEELKKASQKHQTQLKKIEVQHQESLKMAKENQEEMKRVSRDMKNRNVTQSQPSPISVGNQVLILKGTNLRVGSGRR